RDLYVTGVQTCALPISSSEGMTLRSMTRGGVMPSEDAVSKIEKDFPNTTAGSLAKIVHARIKLNAKDYAGAASLLDSSAIAEYRSEERRVGKECRCRWG